MTIDLAMLKHTLFIANVLLILHVAVFTPHSFAQSNLAEQLGYPPDAKLLIIHSDDLGMSHAENEGSFKAMEMGCVNSASAMVPCPWFPEVARWARDHPNHDIGIHLTLTSEWLNCRWGPVGPTEKVSVLTDENGYFFPSCEQLASHATPEAVEAELRSQIEKSIRMGLYPTHLDSHMGCLFFQKDWMFDIYLELGREYGIPVLVSKDYLWTVGEQFLRHISENDLILNRTFTASPEDYLGGMEQYYLRVFKELEPGVSVLLIHTAPATREMEGMTANYPNYPNWCAPWRQADFDFFTSDICKQALEENGIQLITWRELGKLLKK